jgi:hypothetical protein
MSRSDARATFVRLALLVFELSASALGGKIVALNLVHQLEFAPQPKRGLARAQCVLKILRRAVPFQWRQKLLFCVTSPEAKKPAGPSTRIMKNKPVHTRSGVLAGGNWIIDQVKLIDVFPQPEQLANIRSQPAAHPTTS